MPSPGFQPPRMNRTLAVVLAVLGFHLLAIWALQAGLLHRAVALIVPVEVIAELIEPSKPVVVPPPPASPQQQVQKPVAKPQPPKPAPAPVLAPVITNDPVPPTAPTAVIAPPEPAPPITAPAPSPTVVQPSISNADYLNNPRPVYPNASNRLREQGTVELKVLISTAGLPLKVELQKSSGFPRLDASATNAVGKWKFVPGKRDGVPVEMWFMVPIVFELTSK